MEIKQGIDRIAGLSEREIGPTEENVKQKVIVPLLELLGHRREQLEFEYRTRRGGKIDIFIKNVPADCKVIIDTKNYNENLDNFVDQIKEYTFDESSLLTVIANGSEIRIYSPLRGIPFERSLLYIIKRIDLSRTPLWTIISDLLHDDNLQNRKVLKTIEVREQEIRDVMTKEEDIKLEYENKVEGIDSDIETKEDEIEQLKAEKESLSGEISARISEIWNTIGLSLDLFRITPPTPPAGMTPIGGTLQNTGKARRVNLQELVAAGLVKNGQNLYFYHRGRGVFRDEQSIIIAGQNKLKYARDGKLYSISDLAKIIDMNLGLKRDDHGVAGPKYWQTEDGKLLHDLNQIVRRQS